MIKINNDFEMDALIAEYVENKILNFELFWKDVKNVENDSNMLKIYFLDFFLFFIIFFWKLLIKWGKNSGYDTHPKV